MSRSRSRSKPNVIIVFGDQWRAQAFGYAGNPDVQTQAIDRLAGRSVNFTNAVSGCPVCSPYRASLITGQYPLTHGVFLNDVHLEHRVPSIADVFKLGGYSTAYIGKWHLDGRGREHYIPPEARQGFDYWKVLECTHRYNESPYYAGDDDTRKTWEGYDAIAQTRDAVGYINDHSGDENPFFLVLSWGPPHNPYETAPEEFKALYDRDKITLRPNVPEEMQQQAREWIAGYYAHCSALDHCTEMILDAMNASGIAEDTILLFTSDHGDMLGSQGQRRKQKPWDESIRVPFLLSWPAGLGSEGVEKDALIDAPDVMPTLLGLAGLEIPKSVEGLDYSACVRGGDDPSDGSALLLLPQPFGEYERTGGGHEYRGLRTGRHTYARTLEGPWVLYDNHEDPFQLRNLVDSPEHRELQQGLEARLRNRLQAMGDEFLHGDEYVRRWNYPVNEGGTMPVAP